MSNIITTTVACIENRDIFRVEAALRNSAKREPDFSRAVHLANCSLITQRERFAHEEQCEACLAAERVIN